MRVIETKVYTIEEHPNKDKCFSWIRENWHDLNQHSVDEAIECINALHKIIGGNVDYSIGQFSSRGEFISFKNYCKKSLNEIPHNYSLTGVCWDMDLIEGLKSNNPEALLHAVHMDSEYIYSDEGLIDLCICNEYEFNEEGEVN
tara:strand:- start:7986 stop:8417 length:432 start_codon:yes stop_codon:yes gene_type:complete